MSLTRRSFIATAAGFVAAPAFGAVPASGQADVVIIGAGAAGIAAGRRLAAAGKRIAILEASERVGGRCHTDTQSFDLPFDRGAHWLHGADVNPLVPLAAEAKLDIEAAAAGYRLRVSRRNAREGEMEDFLAALFRASRAIAEAARGKADISCAAALPKDLGDLRGAVEFVLGPFRFGKDLAEISALDFSRAADRDSDAFCRQGLGALIANLAQDLPIALSAPVTRIDFSGRAVAVETPKGMFSAPAVIITASTNVLRSGKIKFVPGLPKRHLDAAAGLLLGSYDHIALELADNVLGLDHDELVFERSSSNRTAALLANVRRSSLCVVDVAGAFGRSLAAQGERAMISFATDWLTDLYGGAVRGAVRRSHATRWNAEPWILGASSAAATGAAASRRILMEPVGSRIWFAGEAAHETLGGTVGGAWESGERAADGILKRPSSVGSVPEAPRSEQRQHQRRPRRR